MTQTEKLTWRAFAPEDFERAAVLRQLMCRRASVSWPARIKRDERLEDFDFCTQWDGGVSDEFDESAWRRGIVRKEAGHVL